MGTEAHVVVVGGDEALAHGAADLGENRAQELTAKAAALRDVVPAPRWHFIGQLQRNKVRMLAGTVTLWHSIDRVELAVPLSKFAPGARVLVEVNLSDEVQKGGCRPEEAERWLESVQAHLAGWMMAEAALAHAEGLVNLVLGSLTAARASLAVAVEGWQRRGRIWEASWARLDLAQCLMRSNRHGENSA